MTAAIYNFPTDRVRVRSVPVEVKPAIAPTPLSPRLRAERACLEARNRAEDADARRIWENIADWNALGFHTSRLALGPIAEFERADTPYTARFDPRERPVSLLPWIGAGLSLAAILSVLPDALLSWGVAVAALYLLAATAFVVSRLS